MTTDTASLIHAGGALAAVAWGATRRRPAREGRPTGRAVAAAAASGASLAHRLWAAVAAQAGWTNSLGEGDDEVQAHLVEIVVAATAAAAAVKAGGALPRDEYRAVTQGGLLLARLGADASRAAAGAAAAGAGYDPEQRTWRAADAGELMGLPGLEGPVYQDDDGHWRAQQSAEALVSAFLAGLTQAEG